ncbi:MAG: hypothetical protein DRP55_01220 [Spirochaetes bacterium]|nr:MAG: hypothetical protein DRP55_01220 [Spirochaetota bacterium]
MLAMTLLAFFLSLRGMNEVNEAAITNLVATRDCVANARNDAGWDNKSRLLHPAIALLAMMSVKIQFYLFL